MFKFKIAIVPKLLGYGMLIGVACAGIFSSAAFAQQFSEDGVRAILSRNDFVGVQNYCQRWLQVSPNEWNPNDYMGVALYSQNKYQDSIPYFEKAVDLRPDIAYSWKQLALAEGYSDRFDLMLKVMHMGMDKASNTFDYQMWRWYGAWFEKWSDHDGSIYAWQHAYDKQPSEAAKLELAEAYYAKGRTEAFAQKLDESEADLKKAISLGDPHAKNYLAVVTKYHYVDKPKWQAQADKEYREWCAEEAKKPRPELTSRPINFGQLEFRAKTYQAGHPGASPWDHY